MPKGRQSREQDGLAGFPQEILQDILIRLPAKSVLRCRTVCRLWRRLTNEPAFLVEHPRSISSAQMQIVGTPSVDALHLQKAERQPVPWPRSSLFGASCDGLIVIGDSICNPATRQWAPLSQQKVRYVSIVGLYRHQPSEEYRVLFWKHSNHPSELYCPNDYFVHTVGSKKPRHAICSETLVDEELKMELSGKGPDIRGAAVHLQGNLHIHLKKKGSLVDYHGILVFDTVAESFRQMRPLLLPLAIFFICLIWVACLLRRAARMP